MLAKGEWRLEEFVGFCSGCGKPIHCLHGFLNGIVSEEKEMLYCFQCYEKKEAGQER
ncbi:hypothetical protein B0I26_1141 [Anoxybacillus vitaminiphilus]|uniref:Uncharacterized protein n=1 Tax=Paranoxybacillus vitaminiphilus TaxID=581036 RepID=A0A327Y941_9BACL|nr:hypothetical protein B0I26_1141 [Anoxybacillus vitaminiphilus]